MCSQIRKPIMLEVGDELGIEFEYQLEIATGEISSITEELLDIKKSLRIEDDQLISDSIATILSSKNASTCDNDIEMSFVNDLTAIKDRLYGGSFNLEVILMKGMGGIDKTTIAKSYYDDALIMNISQYYNVDETLSRRIDLMKLLKKNKSLTGEKHKVFTNGQDCPPELEDIGKVIARGCGGLPLAVVLLEKILSLHYTNLPHHLRECFLYIAFVSHVQTTDFILDLLKYSISVDAKQKIMCIHEHAIFVLSFPEYFPAKANRFEGPIMDVDNEAIDILEYFMYNQIRKPIMLEVGDELEIEFEYQMEIATGEISSIAGELMDIKKSLRIEDDQLISDSIATILSSRNASTCDNDIESYSPHDVVQDSCIRKTKEEKFFLHVMDKCNLKKNIKKKSSNYYFSSSF
ncbi:hypothetical protein ACS0TY_034259 [Phlomoides rotata]